MPVKLNSNDIAVAWSEDGRMKGEDISVPPENIVDDPEVKPKWDRTNEEWTSVENFEYKKKEIRNQATDRLIAKELQQMAAPNGMGDAKQEFLNELSDVPSN